MASASPPSAATFDQALRLHQQGELAQAAALYEAVLAREPAHFDALHLLGTIAAQTGDPARAVALIDRALAVDPRQAQAHYHRALALRDQGRGGDALAGFARTVELAPDHAEAWLAQADTLRELGQVEAAVQSYGRALALRGDDVHALFARGVLLQVLGRNTEALADYEAAAALQPDFAGAINNRAQMLKTLGRFSESLAGFDRVAALAPDHAPAHLARGQILEALARPFEAQAAFERALALQADMTEALQGRGRALLAQGQAEAALPVFDRVLTHEGAPADAWLDKGNALQALSRLPQAIAAFERAIALDAGLSAARVNRAMLLAKQGQVRDALGEIERVLGQEPQLAEGWHNRGLLLSELGQHPEALASLERALALRPDDALALASHARQLELMRRLPEALAAYDLALARQPDHALLHHGRGAVLQLLDRAEEALACYDRALALDPGQPRALANRAGALRSLGRAVEASAAYAALLHAVPDHPYARGHHIHTRLQLGDWRAWADVPDLLAQAAAGKQVDMPFNLLALTDSAAIHQAAARAYAADLPVPSAPLWRGERYRHERIRLAYVSADLGFHPVSYLMAELFEAHDRRRFEVSLVALRPAGSDAFERRLRAAFEHVVDASALSDEQIARLLRGRETDIAVDLMGYTQMSRTGMYLHRAAPVQAAYLGFAGTLGITQMDYLVADSVALPAAAQAHFDEKLVRLPATFMPRDTTIAVPPTPTREQAGLPAHGLVFCCFNAAMKIAPPVFGAWMRLLQNVPHSVLWLSDPGETARERLLGEARARGMDPQRLVFAGKTPRIEDHLARLRLADLFLDTLPYNAHTTASDALWAGVPVITRAGEAFASRVAASMLAAAGLPELITTSLEEYEALARALAADPARLAGLRDRLRARRASGALFNTARLCRALEAAYERMHARAQAGLAPEGFDLADQAFG